MKCDVCEQDKYKLRHINGSESKYACYDCILGKTGYKSEVGIVNKVWLKDYGFTTENEIKEVKSRVMLNYKGRGSGYDLGRRNKWGKIECKEPTYGD